MTLLLKFCPFSILVILYTLARSFIIARTLALHEKIVPRAAPIFLCSTFHRSVRYRYLWLTFWAHQFHNVMGHVMCQRLVGPQASTLPLSQDSVTNLKIPNCRWKLPLPDLWSEFQWLNSKILHQDRRPSNDLNPLCAICALVSYGILHSLQLS